MIWKRQCTAIARRAYANRKDPTEWILVMGACDDVSHNTPLDLFHLSQNLNGGMFSEEIGLPYERVSLVFIRQRNVATESCFSEKIGLSYKNVRKLPILANASMAPTRDMETLHRSPRNALCMITGPRTIIVLSYGNQALLLKLEAGTFYY